jgi:outer membrane protein OmpA-like peptidoglycan-associated protein
MRNVSYLPFLLSSILVLNLGCVTQDAATDEKEVSATAIGAAAGAVVGIIAGNQVKGDKDAKRKAQVTGALLGAAVGGGIGNYMDRQEEKLRQKLRKSGVSVTRKGDEILLNMPGNITFDQGKSTIKEDFHGVLGSVGDVLKEFDKSDVKVTGHTDSRGNAQANQTLSENRASAVSSYLQSKGVAGKRLSTAGVGSSQPLGDNQTEEGRSQNRRVEIILTPKEK